MKFTLHLSIAFALLFPFTHFALSESSPHGKMTVTSPAFPPGGKIPDRFTCKGANVNPPLKLNGAPAGTKSLVLILDDPDAPSGLFNHWLVWNIKPVTKEISEDKVPSGSTQGSNDFGKSGYGGPCPPSATHRYFFRVLAIDRTLDLPGGTKRRLLDKAVAGHVLARGELMGRVSR